METQQHDAQLYEQQSLCKRKPENDLLQRTRKSVTKMETNEQVGPSER